MVLHHKLGNLLLIPIGAGLIVLETGNDCIDVLNYTVIDSFKVIVFSRILRVLLILKIGERTCKVGFLLFILQVSTQTLTFSQKPSLNTYKVG